MGTSCNYNEPLEAAHAHINDDRYDMVECVAARERDVEGTGVELGGSRTLTTAIRMSSLDLLFGYFLQLQWATRSGSCAY